MFWVGILLLVSAGSFLYVATIHILPEVYCNTDIHRPHTHHHLPEDHVHDEEHFSKPIELATILLGLLTPYLLFLFHAH
jgi:zinc transporter 9